MPSEMTPTVQQAETTGEQLLQQTEGAGLAFVHVSDTSVDARAIGIADKSDDRELTTDTVMHGNSWTKFIFAALVADMAAKGELDIHASIADLLPKPLPDYPKYSDLANDQRWRDWTLVSLLSHQTGMPNFRFFPPDRPPGFHRDAPLKIYRTPNTAYGYSGEGYQIAQLVVEETLNVDIATEMDQRFFAPLGLERIGMVWKDTFESDYDIGYFASGERFGHRVKTEADAAGSLNTSIHDWGVMLQAFMDGQLISDQAKEIMLTPYIPIRSRHQFPPLRDWTDPALEEISLAAGLGVVLFTGPQGQGFFKGGHDEFADNMTVCLTQSGVCAAAMTNTPTGHNVFPQLIEQLTGPSGMPWKWVYSQLAESSDQAQEP